MDSGVYAVVVGLATVIASGVVSSYVMYRLNRNKDQTFFMRQKAEALYLAADEFGRDLSKHVVICLPVAKGELEYNAMLDLQIANAPDKRNGGFETLNMLANICYPEVLPALKVLLLVRDKFNKLCAVHKQAYKEGAGVGLPWTRQFSELGQEAGQAIEALKTAIIQSARRHAGAPRERL